MQQVIYKMENMQNLQPHQALDSLSNLTGMEREHLVYYLPELEAYKTGNVNIQGLEGGNFRVVGDLASEGEPARYFSPVRVQFYDDREDAMHQEQWHNPQVAPVVNELPQKIDIVLEKQADEQPVYFVRDNHQTQSFQPRQQSEKMPVGVIRAIMKRPPMEDEMMDTYDNYQEQIVQAPVPEQHEQQLLYAVDGLSNYHPYRMAHSPARETISGYLVSYPELNGYQPVHLQQMSNALRSRNPLHLRNNSLRNRRVIGRNLSVQEVIRIALWVAVGILVGVLLGIYFT